MRVSIVRPPVQKSAPGFDRASRAGSPLYNLQRQRGELSCALLDVRFHRQVGSPLAKLIAAQREKIFIYGDGFREVGGWRSPRSGFDLRQPATSRVPYGRWAG